MNRHVERVWLGDLKYENGTVFYSVNPDEYPGVLPEYITTTERYTTEKVWVVYFGDKNPYLDPNPRLFPGGSCLSGLINSLPSDYF